MSSSSSTAPSSSQGKPSWWFGRFNNKSEEEERNTARNATATIATIKPLRRGTLVTTTTIEEEEEDDDDDDDDERIFSRENPLGNNSNRNIMITKEELGKQTWSFLHTLASQFPDEPSNAEKTHAKNLMNAIGALYPCKECAEHFRSVLKKRKPVVDDSVQFQRWMCEVHNDVNERLGKERFSCERVDERWGGVECSGEDGAEGACSFDATRNKRRPR